MFISYAQNCEDVVLWRVFNEISQGTYVDVGAADPTEYSVTKAFYDRGWSGVNVEPAPEFVTKLRSERTRDTTVALCAGEVEGPVTFHYVAGTGLSTVSDEFLETIADHQFEVIDLECEVRRLDRILDEAGFRDRDIHFLKVDVEGAEETVLRSIDLTVWRPWVLVVEATEPLSTAQTHDSWESLIVDNGYVFCLFDGLNRFYAATEHSELVAKLSYPAGVFDQPYTVGSGDRELAARAEDLLAERDSLMTAYLRLESSHLEANLGHQRLDDELKSTLSAYERLSDEHSATLISYEQLRSQHEESLASYQRLHGLYEESLASYQRLHDLYDAQLVDYQNLHTDFQRLHAEHGEAVATSNTLAQRVLDLAAALEAAEQRVDESASSTEALESQLSLAHAEVADMQRSASWKVTRPLRTRKNPKS